MTIVVDGLLKEVPDDATVLDILKILDEPLKHVVVEVNGIFVQQCDYKKIILKTNDKLEIIYPAFGG